MPLYFFDTHDGRSIRDAEGEHLPDDGAALRSAQIALGEMLGGRHDLWADGRFGVEVFNEQRRLLGSLVVTAERVKRDA